MTKDVAILQANAIDLLKQLIATPSFSKEEDNSSTLIRGFLENKDVKTEQYLYNIWAKNKYFDANKPTILLNSHHDTVKPNKGYTLGPFTAIEKDEKLFGLGSNDAGGSLVSLISTFLYFYEREDLKYNLVLAATADPTAAGRRCSPTIYTASGRQGGARA